MQRNISTLFVCKSRHTTQTQTTYSNGDMSSGLSNSATNMVSMLNKEGIPAQLIAVVDNNEIDREVTKHKPTHVLIEALWVVPEKFEVLHKLHPSVTWIVRIHSETPFLANEGVAFEWLFKLLKIPNVYIAFNSEYTYNEFLNMITADYGRVLYLPNYYEGSKTTLNHNHTDSKVLDIGCFGAIRPMKNQLIQAVAAITFANECEKRMRFHVNGTRVEQKGDSVLKNIRSLFANHPHHELIEYHWMPHDKFVDVISSMDICMQVSLSETFNIVTADAVINHVPVVVSTEIDWVCSLFQAKPTLAKSIVFHMRLAHILGKFGLHKINKWKLQRYNKQAKREWLYTLHRTNNKYFT